MLDHLRIALYVIVAILVFLLFEAWVKDHPKPIAPPQPSASAAGTRFVPNMTVTSQTTPLTQALSGSPSLSAPAQGKLITVSTDLFEISIDTRGGDIVSAKLLQYPEVLSSKYYPLYCRKWFAQ